MKLDSNITAIVTGGASGLGEATVRLLAEKGVKCGIFDLNEEKGEAVAKEVGGAFAKVNVTSDEEVDAGFAKIREALGQERILINCAGTGNAVKTASRDKESGAINHFPLDAFNLIIQINLVGTFAASPTAAGMMSLDPALAAIAAPLSIPHQWRQKTGKSVRLLYSAFKSRCGRHDFADCPRFVARRHSRQYHLAGYF